MSGGQLCIDDTIASPYSNCLTGLPRMLLIMLALLLHGGGMLIPNRLKSPERQDCVFRRSRADPKERQVAVLVDALDDHGGRALDEHLGVGVLGAGVVDPHVLPAALADAGDVADGRAGAVGAGGELAFAVVVVLLVLA